MSVSAADFAELQQHIAEAEAGNGETDSSHLSELQSIPAVIAWMFKETRDDTGDVEAALDRCELLCRAIPLSAPAVRETGGVLKLLGFVELSARLKWLAGQRRHDLRPLVDN